MTRLPRTNVRAAGRTARAPFLGEWQIIHMELWNTDLDLLGPPHLTLDHRGHGSLRFLAIEAELDYRSVERQGHPGVEFSFEGHDDGDRISGRGWAVLTSDALGGRIFIHQGDDSGFTAVRRVTTQRASRR